MASASVIERLRNWPKPRSHEEKVEQAIDRLMLVEIFIYWYIQELEDLKAQLSRDPVLILLVPIADVMIAQLWQLMRRWIAVKAEVIKAVRDGLIRMERVIEGDGFWVQVTYNKYTIDLVIYLNGGGGDYARIPSLGIPEAVLKAMRLGWRASDSSKKHDKPAMTTHFAWQAIAWLISMSGAEANIYAEGLSISLDGIKPRWKLQINGFEVEWFSDVEAYQEIVKLPKELLLIAMLHAVLGDGSNRVNDGERKIILSNDDRGILEELRARLESELKISMSISPAHGNVWRYVITGEGAKKLAEALVKALEELAPVLKRLYDILASYELIRLKKWAMIARASKYVYNESKVWFAKQMWTPHFTRGSTVLKIVAKDAELAEELRRKAEVQGIDAVIKKYVDRNETYYEVRINWNTLKRYLCNEELRAQLIEAAKRAIENCKVGNMTGKGRKKDCSQIPAAKWLEKLQEWHCED